MPSLAERENPLVRRKTLASVRVSPGGTFAAAAILTFVSVILLRTHRDFWALILISLTWLSIPLLIFTDRLIFDGIRLRRGGLVAWARAIFGQAAFSIDLSDIERVEVNSLRTLRRGGNVRYRYRVEVLANNSSVTFASGGKKFREMIQSLLPCIAEQKLDARACELRDHLADIRAVRAEAARLKIAPPAVLENAGQIAVRQIERHRQGLAGALSHTDLERAVLLRRVANDLRIAGGLQQSAEAFRRALLIMPQNGWLIYEYARLLRSQASTFGDARILGRACAALRLAVRRSPEDARLLERVGESFFEYGDPARAEKTFRRALEINDGAYRAQVGLAEVALNDGKLAHVIHHYNEAVRIASDKATRRMALRESDYYSRLNDDEDYLAAELRRMNWLEGAGRVQRLTARVSFAALLVALLGASVDQLLASFGWALASSSIIGWSGALILRKFLGARRRVEAHDA